MLSLITNANVYSPEPIGIRHILIGGRKILSITENIPHLDDSLDVKIIDIDGQTLIPGLIDAHTHTTGGGGEAGFSTRVPPVLLSQFTQFGVTTVVGLLGTDDVTRSTSSLVAQTYGLREQGLSAYCYTGGYHLPATTLTGSVLKDIVHIEPIIGAGEVAISDHRSSQPTLDEIIKLAGETHVAGMMTGKAGVLHLHLGDGERGLDLVNLALDTTEIPARVFNPTHINRRKALFTEACELTKRGCTVDITAFPAVSDSSTSDEYSAAEAVSIYLDKKFNTQFLTVSSDGGGCLPTFDEQGQMTHMDVGTSKNLLNTIQQLLHDGRPIEKILPFFTSNVSKLLRFKHKGHISKGADADLVILDKNNKISSVMALGTWHYFENKVICKDVFEN